MINYKYKTGLYIGRFQPLHMGHTQIIDKMLDECETVIIAVGSAQESGTERNPLNFVLRRLLIHETYLRYADRIIILPINDRQTYSDDPTWGDYLLNNVYDQCGLRPDAIYEGEENVRTNWYDNYDIPVIKIPRAIFQVSGTEVRQALLEGKELFVRVHMPIAIYDYYNLIRKEIQNATVNARCNPVD